MEMEFVSVKVSKKAHEELRNLKFEFRLDNYPEVVDRLIEEHQIARRRRSGNE